MRALMSGDMGPALKAGPYAEPAFVPASPWLSNKVPAKPRVARNERVSTGTLIPSWSWTLDLGSRPADIRQYAVNIGIAGDKWLGWTSNADSEIVINHRNGEAPQRVAIVAIDRYGTASEPVVVDVPPMR
jgi:hypothetical protein